MVKNTRLGKEISVNVVNKIGVLADMSKVFADCGINIKAVTGYAVNKEATIMLITDDNLRAIDALKKKNYKSIKENEVVIVELEDKPGALKGVTAKLAGEDIDIKYMYGTTCPGGCPAALIISTSNNEKALLALRTA